jgi:tRNA (cmo5U34)-methyltransferase
MAQSEKAQPAGWTEETSTHFIDLGRYYVPEREAQIGAICDLIPDLPNAPDVVELCCGEGLLSRAILTRFPAVRLHALDGSQTMLDSTVRLAGTDAGRLETRLFDLAAPGWRQFGFPARAIVSSLAIHHLDGPGKQALFRDMAAALAPGGALIIADLVAPATPQAAALAAQAWDDEVRRRAREIDGNEAAFDRFRAEGWNYYRDPEADPIDQPSSLFDQLRWMAEAGLEAVDAHWMKAGHALFSGRKPL